MPVASGETSCVSLASGAPLITSFEDAGLVVDIFPLHGKSTVLVNCYVLCSCGGHIHSHMFENSGFKT